MPAQRQELRRQFGRLFTGLGDALEIEMHRVVAGQMLVATINDYTGFAGYGSSHSVDGWRLAGVGLVLVGVWVFQKGG